MKSDERKKKLLRHKIIEGFIGEMFVPEYQRARSLGSEGNIVRTTWVSDELSLAYDKEQIILFKVALKSLLNEDWILNLTSDDKLKRCFAEYAYKKLNNTPFLPGY